MQDFIRGWRRKLGLTTLVLAFAFLALWMRSYGKPKLFKIPTGPLTSHWLVSFGPDLWWARVVPLGKILEAPADSAGEMFDEYTESQIEYLIAKEWEKEPEIEWKWKLLGFGVGHFQREPSQFFRLELTLWALPYWSLVIPLTLLSACLIIPPNAIVKKHRGEVAG